MEFPLSWGLSKTGLPLIIVTCTDDSGKVRNLCFMIDTGATENILLSFVYNLFKNSFKHIDDQGSVMSIDGTTYDTPRVQATFNFEDNTYTSDFMIFNTSDAIKSIEKECGVQIHGAIGIRFLVENEWIIDFEKLVITSK